MKKIVLLFTVLVLFAGCKHRKAIRVEDETPQNSEESFVLHPTIYKGILDIDSLSVAIFDKNSCGNNFYDSTKLSTIPLSNLKKIPEHEIKPVAAWGVQADSIIRWVAP